MPAARDIGFATAVALVLGNMIGSGVFLLPASLAPYRGTSLLGWTVTTGGSILLALVFARLAREHPAAGGPYAYTRRGFGDLAGFLVAWGYWISCWSTNAALAVAFVGYLDPFVPSIVRSPVAAALLAIATLWTLTVVNVTGVRAAGRVQLVTTMLKVLPLALVGIGGLAWFEPARFSIDAADTATLGRDTLAVVTLTLWAFLGLECATIPAGSVRDPERTIPRATLTGTVLAAAIYIVSTIGVMSVLSPAALAQTTAPFADAARVIAGDWASKLVAIGAAVSCFGALNGWILMVGQMPLAIADEGLFPKAFAKRAASGTPSRGIVIAAVLSTTLIGMNYSQGLVTLFTRIILLATLSTLLPYVFSSLSCFVRADGGAGMPRLTRRTSIIAAGAFIYAMVAIAGAGQDVVYLGFLLLLAGLPVFVWVKRTRPTERTS
ncbi:MAG: amino acid permease [Acidobacteriota bacterium]|nr:amino acid permease [Acidobacteriota bacterium]